MMDMKQGVWIRKQVNGLLHKLLGEKIPGVNNQDQIFNSENY